MGADREGGCTGAASAFKGIDLSGYPQFLLYPLALQSGHRPLERKIPDPRRIGGGEEMVKRLQEDLALQLEMEGDSKQVAHHEGQKDSPGRLDLLGHIAGHTGGNRGNASSFYGALDQRDRLMADRSSRSEQSDVGLRFDHRLGDVLG